MPPSAAGRIHAVRAGFCATGSAAIGTACSGLSSIRALVTCPKRTSTNALLSAAFPSATTRTVCGPGVRPSMGLINGVAPTGLLATFPPLVDRLAAIGPVEVAAEVAQQK